MSFRTKRFKSKEHRKSIISTRIGIVRGLDSNASRLRGSLGVVGRYSAGTNPYFQQVITDTTPNREIKKILQLNVTGLEFFPFDERSLNGPEGSNAKQLHILRLAYEVGIDPKKIGPKQVVSLLNKKLHEMELAASDEFGKPLCEEPFAGVSPEQTMLF
jgi:hypothetical protein